MTFKKVKKWYQSLGIKSGLGLIAMALGIAGIGITSDQLDYLYQSIPAAVTGTIILYRRLTQYTSGLGMSGWLALIVGVLTGSYASTLPGDIVTQFQSISNLYVGIIQIVLTVLGAYGVKRADAKVRIN